MRGAAPLLLGLALAVSGCDIGGGDLRGVFVGRVSGTDAYVAVVSTGEGVGGYVCDGRRISTWFRGPRLLNGRARLQTREGESLGAVTVAGDTASGTLMLFGARHRFSARKTSGGTGLYRAKERTLRAPGSREAGWILLPDGTQRGAVNTFIEPSSATVVPARELAPGQTTTSLSPGRTVSVRRVTPGSVDPDGF